MAKRAAPELVKEIILASLKPALLPKTPWVTNGTTAAIFHHLPFKTRADPPRVVSSGASPMAPSIGASAEKAPLKPLPREAKKKGCKKAKCSKWKGGKCRCGRD
jgi:hypothetical protein